MTANPVAGLRIGTLDAAPGAPSTAVLYVTNQLDEPATFALHVAGIEPEWIGLPPAVGPVAPGVTVDVPVRVLVPVGYPAAELTGTITATLEGPAPSAATGLPPAVTDVRLVVGDGAAVLANLDPPEVIGRYGGRFDVVLRNRLRTPVLVELSALRPDPGVDVRFADRGPVLEPGTEVRVRGRLRANRPVAGGEQRRPFAVRVQGRSTPVLLEGTLVQRPLFAGWALRAFAIFAVVCLWAAVGVVAITKLSNHEHKSAASKAVASAPPASGASGPSAGASGGAGTSPAKSAAAAAAAARKNSSGFGKAGAANTDRVQGRVNGPSKPGGVTVTITPTSLASTASQGATVTTAADVSSRPGMVWAQDIPPPDAALTAAVTGTATLTTTTFPDGSWYFVGVRAPGTYLLTFSKPGFTTRKYVITTTAGKQTVQLNAVLRPAIGAISGTVTGSHGPLGDAQVTVTSGPVTVTTRTPSVGSGIGTFSLTGLSTPGLYLVTASAAGYAAQTTTVTLGPSSSVSGVHLALSYGLGTIQGVVVSGASANGVPNLSVSVNSGHQTLSTTTTSKGIIGHYTLPDLPVPGTYTVKVSGAGYVTATQRVMLTPTTPAVNIPVVPSGADVTGVVSTAGAHGLVGLQGAGAVLSNQVNTFKTLTEPNGSFDFGSVPSGNYVLTVQEYGYASKEAEVDVNSGQTQTVDLTLVAEPAGSQDTATLKGTVYSLFDNTTIAGMEVVFDGGAMTATTDSSGNFTLSGLPAGLHTITALPNQSQNFESLTEQVAIPLGATVFAPPLELPALDNLSGVVTAAATKLPVSGAVVTVTSTGSAAAGASGTSGTSGSKGTSGTSGTSGSGGTTGTATTTAIVRRTARGHATGACPTVPATTTTSGGQSTTTASASTCTTGAYHFSRLPHGNYQLTVTAPGFVTSTQEITLQLDESALQNVVLTLVPEINVVTYATTAGVSSQVGGVCVTVSNGSGAPSFSETQLSSSTGPVTFPSTTYRESLIAGDTYVATFWQPTGTATSATVAGVPPAPCPQNQAELAGATPVTFTAGYDNISVTSVYLNPLPPSFSVTLSYPYYVCTTGTGCPKGATSSTLTCPLQQDAPSPSSAQGACPAVDPTAEPTVTIIGNIHSSGGNQLSAPISLTPISPSSPVWSVPAKTLQAADLIDSSVTLQVTGGAFAGYSQSVTLTEPPGAAAQNVDVTIPTNPVAVTGSVVASTEQVTATGVTTASGSAVNTATVSVDPASITPPNSSSQAVTVTDSAGALTWSNALPGVYALTTAAAGYRNGSATVTVGACAGEANTLCAAKPPAVTITMLQLETLTVAVPAGVGEAGANVYLAYDPGAFPQSPLAIPQPFLAACPPSEKATADCQVTATDGGNGATSTAGYLTGAPAGSAVSFSYLSQPTGGYQVVLTAPGYQTWFSPLQFFDSGSPPALTPTLTPAATVSGTVEAVLGSTTSAFSGAYVEADRSGSCAAIADLPQSGFSAADATVTTTADTGGGYTLGSNATVTIDPTTGALSGDPNGGLCAGGSYNVFASPVTPSAAACSVYPVTAAADVCSNYTIAYVSGRVLDPGSNPVTLTMQASHFEQDFVVMPTPGTTFPSNFALTLSVSGVGVTQSAGSELTTDCTTTNSPQQNAAAGCSITANASGQTPVTYTSLRVQLFDIFPTVYTFQFTASAAGSAYLPVSLTQISYASITSNPATIDVTIPGTSNIVQGAVYAKSGCTTWPANGTSQSAVPTPYSGCSPIPGVTLDLISPNTGYVLSTAITDSHGTYSFGGLQDGSYEVAATGGFTYVDSASLAPGSTSTWAEPADPAANASPPNQVTVNSNDTVTMDLELTESTANIGLTLAVPAGVTGHPLDGVTATLTETSSSGAPPVSSVCAGQLQSYGLAGTGTTVTGFVSASGSGETVTFPNVAPDYYTLSVSGGALPTPSSGPNPYATALVTCPNGHTNLTNDTFTVPVAQQAGTVNVGAVPGLAPSAANPTVSVQPANLNGAAFPSQAVTLTPGSGNSTLGGAGSWAYSVYLPESSPGTADAATVTATPATGYSVKSQTGYTTTLVADLASAKVQVVDDEGNPIVGATVTLADTNVTLPGGESPATTDSSGDATFNNLPPDATSSGYTVTATYDGEPPTASANVSLTPGQTYDGTTSPLQLSVVEITGTVTESETAMPVTVQFCTDASCSTVLQPGAKLPTSGFSGSPLTYTLGANDSSWPYWIPDSVTYLQFTAPSYSTSAPAEPVPVPEGGGDIGTVALSP